MRKDERDLQGDTAGSERHAALVLHSATDADRSWLMAQLPAPHRARVQPLLAELQRLGVPRDPTLVRAALQPSSPPMGARPRTATDRLAAAAPGELARLLAEEPATLAAQVLAMLPNDARAGVLRQFATGRRALVARLVPEVATGPATTTELGRTLLEEVTARLPAPTAGRRPGRRSLLSWLPRSGA